MTEEEWLTCDDPEPMMSYLRGKTSDRKLRLLDIECCRLLLPYYDAAGLALTGKVITLAERHADGLAMPEELDATREELRDSIIDDEGAWTIGLTAHADLAIFSVITVDGARCGNLWWDLQCTFDSNSGFRVENAPAKTITLIREIFGNPFRPVVANPSWLTSTVVALAEGIYQERAFDRMPILADALEEGGCDHADILTHCRESGEHVRGCWVVDLLTGRK